MFDAVLIANRGEIACRVMRTCRELGIRTAVVYSDPDAGAQHVREADYAIRLPGSSAAETYLDIDAVIEAAQRVGADALHPGYGFLAENAALAQRCAQAGITFVGPSPDCIRQMGSKLESKHAMAKAGVPLPPSAEVAAGSTHDETAAAADGVGYPLLIKASAGGGGKAMRIIEAPEQLDDGLESCRREATRAFDDDTVFLERYLSPARHVEIQVFGDQFGTAIHLGERECSIQRRYQKIIEESPSPAVDGELRAAMGAAAVAAVRAIGYVGAGTVEFLVDEAGRFYFLEMNTRLQVEHPVTELVTGLDLVRLQLLVAAGQRLPITSDVTPTGHAVEARLYAEDVAGGFLPASGRLHSFEIPDTPGVRVDAGVADGSEVSIHYDPMLAKVIGFGRNRDEAISRLSHALRSARIDGVKTNNDLLVAILAEPDFRAGRTHTEYLSVHDPVELAASASAQLGGSREAYFAAAALAHVELQRSKSTVLPDIAIGFRAWPAIPQQVVLEAAGRQVSISLLRRRSGMQVKVDDVAIDLTIHENTGSHVDLTINGIRRKFDVRFDGDRAAVRGAESTLIARIAPRFASPADKVEAGSLMAPMPGTIIRIAVALGDEVKRGDLLMVMEAMKMEHRVCAGADAVITSIKAAVGDQVEGSQVLVVLDEAGS